MSRSRQPIRAFSLKAMPLKQFAARATLVFAVGFAGTLMVLSRGDSPFMGGMRATVSDVLVPVFSVLSRPMDAARDAGNWLSDMGAVYSENRRLKAQNATLLQWQAAASQLQVENESLRKLIRTVPEGKSSYVAARIVSESGGPYRRSALLNGGRSDGIAEDQAVIGPEGLVGRITEAGQFSSRVLLLTDIGSRIPVMGENSRERSIASGNNNDKLTLDYVANSSKLEVGERILTSGDGGIFPPNIPVGVVTAISGGSITVQPLTDWRRLEYVSVVKYEF